MRATELFGSRATGPPAKSFTMGEIWNPENGYGQWDTFGTVNEALPCTKAAGEKTRFSVGGGRASCAEYRTKDVAMTSPMAAKTTTRNHRWETEDGSDTGSYAAHPRLKLSRGCWKRPFCRRRGSRRDLAALSR